MPRTEKNEEVNKALDVLTAACSLNDREIIPRYPYVLVRKVPREIFSKNGIWLPNMQGKGPGKPIGEGVVIRTWEPHEGKRKSELSPGDLVTFPHYAGYPADGNADGIDNLWFIPDISNADITKVGILGYFQFALDDIRSELLKMPGIDETESCGDLIDLLLEQYDVIPKKVNPRTRIG